MDIYVRNLSQEVTEEDVRRTFEAYGTVNAVRLVAEKYSGRPIGFAFVTMPNFDEALSAINALNGFELKGRSLQFGKSRSRFERRRGRERRKTARAAQDRRKWERRHK